MGNTPPAGGKITCMLGKIKHKIFKSKEKVDLKQKFKNVKFYDYTSGKAMYNYFVTHKQAVGICRKVIGPGYIEKVFTNKKMRGTIANIENPGQDTAEHVVKIYKTSQSVDAIIDFSDNRLLAAAIYFGNSNPNYPQDTIIIFDGEVFNQDIYITHLEDNYNNPVNYYIELEQMTLDLNENTVAPLKDIRNVA